MEYPIKPILKKLFSGFPYAEITDETVAVYIRLLSDIPPDELRTVVDQCLIDSKFLPTIAEIKERHRDMVGGGLALETAAEQWGQVQKAISREGHTWKGKFKNPITAKVVDAMGWMELCMSENQMADRAHFMKMYEQCAEREEKISRLTPEARRLAEEKGGLKPMKSLMDAYQKSYDEHNQIEDSVSQGAPGDSD